MIFQWYEKPVAKNKKVYYGELSQTFVITLVCRYIQGVLWDIIAIRNDGNEYYRIKTPFDHTPTMEEASELFEELLLSDKGLLIRRQIIEDVFKF